jgi:DNA-binding transcriptional regulator YdaS (Cro superfamily)
MPTLQAQAVRKAIQAAGGDLALAARLGITVTKLNLMAEGLASVPNDIFFAVADLLVEKSVEEAKRNPNGLQSSDDASKED